MRSVLAFAIYVLKNWKLSVTPPKWLRDPLGGRDLLVGSRCNKTWNSLPGDLRNASSLSSFRYKIKTDAPSTISIS